MSVLDPRVSGLDHGHRPAVRLGELLEPTTVIPGFFEAYQRGALTADLHPWCDRWMSATMSQYPHDQVRAIRTPEGWGALWFLVYEHDRHGLPSRGELLVCGAFDHGAILPFSGCISSDVIYLRPGGMRAILGMPASEVANQRFRAEDLWGAHGRTLLERLMGTTCRVTRIALLCDAVKSRTQRHDSVDARMLADGIQRLARAQPVRKIADWSGCSQRHLQRLFADGLGMSPKRFETLLRMRRVIADTLRDRDPDWAHVALRHGFCDQSHLTHVWSSIYPLPPERLHRAYRREGLWVEGMIILKKGVTL
jgi:AraC-like DNA-binding protein